MILQRSATVAVTLAGLLWASSGSAQLLPRLVAAQRGDFVLLGNTLVHNCADFIQPPLVGQVGECGAQGMGVDVAWRSDEPEIGQALADQQVAEARSTAVLSLPQGARVTHARLYWSALAAAEAELREAMFERPGEFSEVVSAQTTVVVAIDEGKVYQSSVDVTERVQQAGAGAFRLGGIDMLDPRSGVGPLYYAAWWMVVLYESQSEPWRQLSVFDGLQPVEPGAPAQARLEGFTVPAGFDGKLGVIAFEGDQGTGGDELRFGAELPLTSEDALESSRDFFDGSRRRFGLGYSEPGDLPQVSGEANSFSGFDLDIVDVTARLQAGQTAASVEAFSDFDIFYLGGLVTSIATLEPDFAGSSKSVTDLDGPPLRPGDELRYEILVENGGFDAARGVAVVDPLPGALAYVPGSMRIAEGVGTGPLTDALGDDAGDVISTESGTLLSVRVGAGAGAEAGGRLLPGESVRLEFRATVRPGVVGMVENQARVIGIGEKAGSVASAPTDGNGPEQPGAGATVAIVGECATAADCSVEVPVCDTRQPSSRCVQCVGDSDCPVRTPVCGEGQRCVCTPSGVELCSGGRDEDCDGAIDAEDRDCTDSDGDGLVDGLEDQLGSDPADADSDDDGVLDGEEIGPGEDTDRDGLVGVLDADGDNDGLLDGTEQGTACSHPDTDLAVCIADADEGASSTNPRSADTDGGGRSDGSEDANLNGRLDPGETDPLDEADDEDMVDIDLDGLSDRLEATLGSSRVDADSDDDGLLDGLEPNPSLDMDGDGLLSASDPDSDDDGLLDGTEEGSLCDAFATSREAGICVPDADPETRTFSLLRDSDRAGASDGSEDWNLNGRLDPDETSPAWPSDDGAVADTDGDGLSDRLERFLGADSEDPDSDDDGLPDGLESNPALDADGDGRRQPLDSDSDGDGLRDGTERGLSCLAPGTSRARRACVADRDPATTTAVLVADSDGGGAADGAEDRNGNGRLDPGERDPRDPSDDASDERPAVVGDSSVDPAEPSVEQSALRPGEPESDPRGAGFEGGAGLRCSTSPGAPSPGPGPLFGLLGLSVLACGRRRRRGRAARC